MKTKAVRLFGKNDLRIEEFELRSPGENEILARVVSDSTCMSTYKAVVQGADHKRVQDSISSQKLLSVTITYGVMKLRKSSWRISGECSPYCLCLWSRSYFYER